MTKNLVVSVGAGQNQRKFIEKLKESGYVVAAFGKGRNDQRVIEICDYFAEIDTADAQAAIEWIESLGIKPIAAGSFAGGVAILTLQKIINYFDLPCRLPEEFLIGMNKLEQQKVYEKYHLSHIETYGPDELRGVAFLETKQYIIKPFIGRGSCGVRIVSGTEVQHIVKNNEINENEMIQECVTGTEYRVLVYVQNGEIKILAPIKRQSYENTFLLGRLSFDKIEIGRITQFFVEFIRCSGIENAIFKADIICGEKDINLIEVDIGVGGGIYFKEYISKCFDLDLVETYIRIITGQKIEKKEVVYDNLVMDYVFNWTGMPVTYELEMCKSILCSEYKAHKLLVNSLFPEKKRMVESNADFIFTVIHETSNVSVEEVNKYVNERLFVGKEDD